MKIETTATLPPSPPERGPFGHYRDLSGNPMDYLSRCAGEFGDVVMFRIGSHTIVSVSHPDLIERILVTENKKFRKAHLLHLAEETLGQGLLTSEGSFWLRQRRLAAPAFHRERIRGYAETMVAATEAMLDGWRSGSRIDVHAEMMGVTLEIVTRVLFGANIEAETIRETGEALEEALNRFNDYQSLTYQLFDWFPRPSKRRYRRSQKTIDAIIYRLIREHREKDLAPEEDPTLLGMYLNVRDDDGSGMSDKQLRDECATMFLAGHETTANALTFALHLLSANPDKRERLERELESVLGDRPPTSDDYGALDYTRKVVKETLRLYPPAWRVGRENLEEYDIGEYTVPAQSQIMMCQSIVHRDERWYTEPNRFLPERWTEEFEASLPRYAFFPFGGGPRLCIGYAFAEMEAALLLASICRRFRVDALSNEPPELYPSITLRPKGGLPSTITLR